MCARRSRSESLHPAVPGVLHVFFVAWILISGASALEAQEIEVGPDLPSSIDPLVVTVTGFGTCPVLSSPVVGDGTVDFFFSNHCPILPPDPEEFTIYTVAEPLPSGVWEVRLLIDTVTTIPTVVDSQGIIVSDFAVDVTPSTADRDEPVTAHLTGFGLCVFPDEPVIEPGRIRLGVTQQVLCDPPVNTGHFDFEIPLGTLSPGDYRVDFVLSGHPRDMLVAETELEVTPIGTCQPEATTLCLGGRRFRVHVAWEAPDGRSGDAFAVEDTLDSGLFWFFDESNIELVVKVLDACDTSFNSFWVFAGGLTDLGVGISVTDTQTDETVTYVKAAGEPFEAITDTAAFSTCP